MRCTGSDILRHIFACLLILVVDGGKEEKKCASMNGTHGRCLPLSKCFDVYVNMDEASTLACRLSNNEPGICCTSKTEGRIRILNSNKNSEEMITLIRRKLGSSITSTLYSNNFTLSFWTKLLPKSIIQKARLKGLHKLLVRERIEAELLHLGVTVNPGTPEFLHQHFLRPFPEALKQSRLALLQDESNKSILSKFPSNTMMSRIGVLARQSFNFTAVCPRRPCSFIQAQNKYRSFDGSCNNVGHGNWGSAFIALDRLLPPHYKDRFTQPRQTGVDGLPLPSARKISSICIDDVNRQSSVASLMTMTWGQFINHDITLTAISAMTNGAGIKCCSGAQSVLQILRHEDCFPIVIARDDPFYGPTGQTCMEFVRSLPAASERKSCEFGFRDQLNEVTSFLDGSVIYGSTNSMARALRRFNKGKLKVIKCFGNDHLPFINPNSSSCDKPFQNFFTGDIRATEQAHLSSLHTIFLREHNHIAEMLNSLNPHWTDETIFQESRKIIGAMLQHVTYNEFLPVVIGSQIVESADLKPLRHGYNNNYRSDINPGVFNEFAAAANRYGHSLIQGTMEMLNAQDEIEGTLNVRDQFAAPVPIYFPQNLDRIIRGLTKQAVQKSDAFMSHDVTRHLYQFNSRFGLDLAAANIQRGRDHGLPPYNSYRQFCGLDKVTSFETMHVKGNIKNKFKKAYKNVDDIDLWIGLLSEQPLKGALVGPTLACLLAEQYWRVKVADRFWYEHRNSPGAFTLDQLREIRRVTLARLLCDNGDKIHQMQPLAFLQPADWNPRTGCSSADAIPHMDFNPWKEILANVST
uniref:Peroxidase n=1 Tax=Strigamia maritima TaxID=126957 RepID=T1IJ78_STRMM